MNKTFIIILIIFSLIGGIAYLLFIHPDTQAENQQAWEQPPMPVSVVTVNPIQINETVMGIGTIEAVRQVDIASEVSGRIDTIHFRSGDTVSEGDLILHLNDELDNAELKRLKAKLNLVSKEYKRMKKLEGVAVPDSRIDEARSLLDEVSAQKDSVITTKDKKNIVAPFDGVLGVRRINLGQYLNPGDPIVNITDLSHFNVDFKLPENSSPHIKVGQKVTVTVDALGTEQLQAQITTIEPQIERDLHSILVQAKIISHSKLLRPGLYAKVIVDLNLPRSVILLPETAVERSTFGNTVYIVKKSDKDEQIAEQVTVETGRRLNAQIVITQGLSAGDMVIVSGQNRLHSGAFVSLKNPEETVSMTLNSDTSSSDKD
ncbi:MAG: efflux RND transporter periplasmic adaptor subunit [Gammaproteobacteria bacterium]|nr:efflux RND transporter periplasmic adaptor subunit [Gammaproteobacteria bacterium]